MNTIEQAYIEGFLKRASEYGFNNDEAFKLAGIAEDAGLEVKDLGLGGNEFRADASPTGIKITEQGSTPTSATTPAPAPKGFLSRIFGRSTATPISQIGNK
jgi:hypothetical protein